jgi:hypothetical protein
MWIPALITVGIGGLMLAMRQPPVPDASQPAPMVPSPGSGFKRPLSLADAQQLAAIANTSELPVRAQASQILIQDGYADLGNALLTPQKRVVQLPGAPSYPDSAPIFMHAGDRLRIEGQTYYNPDTNPKGYTLFADPTVISRQAPFTTAGPTDALGEEWPIDGPGAVHLAWNRPDGTMGEQYMRVIR